MSALSDILVQLGVGIVPLGVAYLAFRSATDASKKSQQSALLQVEHQAEVERSKVDAEAFIRAKTIYEDALAQMEKQMTRMQGQASQLGAELVNEQSSSVAMRDQIRRLQAQIRALERTVLALRSQLVDAGLSPAPPSDLTGPHLLRPQHSAD